MLNPINWIFLVVEIVDFLDEEMAGWVRMRQRWTSIMLVIIQSLFGRKKKSLTQGQDARNATDVPWIKLVFAFVANKSLLVVNLLGKSARGAMNIMQSNPGFYVGIADCHSLKKNNA